MADEIISESQRRELDQQFEKAMNVLVEAQRSLNDMGISPPALASALCASYIHYVAAVVASAELPSEMVIRTAKEAIDTMNDMAVDTYNRFAKKLAEDKDAA